jgi:hypothetical protein
VKTFDVAISTASSKRQAELHRNEIQRRLCRNLVQRHQFSSCPNLRPEAMISDTELDGTWGQVRGVGSDGANISVLAVLGRY